ncbi:MAG: arsenate reductase ArsC [Alphaproteobacteria bacterium]|nr:arsenate reductase ArsC [Alphaproteobacteria bacterium]
MATRPRLVLFLSTGNAARSLLAEALLNAKKSESFRARSAGFQPLPEAHPETLALLKAEGVPTDHLHTKGWKEFFAAASLVKIDVIVTLSEEARVHCPMPWPGNPVRVHWAVDDPLGATREDMREWKFRKCFATLQARLNALVRSRAPQSPEELLLHFKDIGMVV